MKYISILLVIIMASCMGEFAPLDGEVDFKPNKPFSEILTVKGGNFGYVPMNKSIVRKLILKNNIDATLTISNINYPDGFDGPALVAKKVLGNDSIIIEVNFAPVQKKVYNSKITVDNNFNTKLELPITGTSISSSGFFTDNRDMTVYPWVKIGDQIWMAKNLAYLPAVNKLEEGSEDREFSECYYVYGYDGNDVDEAKKTSEFNQYGVLYNHEATYNACPKGWHVASKSEWEALTSFLINTNHGYNGSGEDIAKSLASKSNWKLNDDEGTIGSDPQLNNDSGFNALPAGCRYISEYNGLGEYNGWWDRESYYHDGNGYRDFTYARILDSDDSYFSTLDTKLDYAFSVRCVKDNGLQDYSSLVKITTDVDFGYVAKSKTVSKEIKIRNNNAYSISIIKAEYPGDFSGTFEGEIPAGSEKTFILSLTPSGNKEYVDQIIKLHTDIEDILEVKCKASSIYDTKSPLVTFNDLDFAYVEPGSTKTRIITLTNNCNFDFAISGIVYPEGFSGETSDFTIAKGESKDLEVLFVPSEEKKYDSILKLKTDFGEIFEIHLIAKSSGLATIVTEEVSNVQYATAFCSGNITNIGDSNISSCGIVWGISKNPTIVDNDGMTSESTANGIFTCELTKLRSKTTYYVRAYAKNLEGTAYGEEKIFTTNDINDLIEMVEVAGGEFQMGCTDGLFDEKPVHSVRLSSYKIGKYEVTQTLWKAVMGDNPSHFKGDNLPVENISWDMAQKFITKINQMTGDNYRLLTEAEWEYAANGGGLATSTSYAGSNTLEQVAWYEGNSGNITHPVGQKQANELGIFDMTGNVWEWCNDWYSGTYYSNSPLVDPRGPSSCSDRVHRGGGWNGQVYGCRITYRNYPGPPSYNSYGNYYDVGLRLARSLQ